jgi:hypothetical protein
MVVAGRYRVARYFQVLEDSTGSYRVNPNKITDPSRNTLIDKAVI